MTLRAELLARLPEDSIQFDSDVVGACSQDRAIFESAGTAAALVMPRNAAEVTVKLVPLPAPPATAVAHFGELAPAGKAIAAEHGVGTLKRQYLERELDPTQLAVQRQIKALLDPDNRFNPGKAL